MRKFPSIPSILSLNHPLSALRWETEADPEETSKEVHFLRDWDKGWIRREISVSEGGLNEETGRPYYLITERDRDAGPLRFLLKSTLESAKALGEEWASEW